ncbi:hypothetical protein [Foetidibacter luteolus]|uniref:hypothetical protein n=1 Tax=Foetidibacter luteolus TaxID=2608880 RepID=UPI00129BA305|nr:hypothetical protein [Foetidibacter luteolus]
MGLFNFFKKSPAAKHPGFAPYKDSSANAIYNLLFCDNLNLYNTNQQPPYTYPFDVLFSETSSVADLQKITDNSTADPRIKVLAYNKMLSAGHKPANKEILAVIVEVGLDGGLDVLASFSNGTARYINQTGKILVWETTTDEKANELTSNLFSASAGIVNQIGPWDKPRCPHPPKGNARITFLVSDGLYFGEGAVNVLFNDAMASPALMHATQLMQYLTEKSLQQIKQ